MPTVEITHRAEFSSAHRLFNPSFTDEENQRVFGPCYRRHGHNYVVEVTVRGEIPEDSGMVMDLNVLSGIVREKIFTRVDHKHLNFDVPFLDGVIPTAENVAVAIWDLLADEVARYEGAALSRIRLRESRMNYVDYYGPAGLPAAR